MPQMAKMVDRGRPYLLRCSKIGVRPTRLSYNEGPESVSSGLGGEVIRFWRSCRNAVRTQVLTE